MSILLYIGLAIVLITALAFSSTRFKRWLGKNLVLMDFSRNRSKVGFQEKSVTLSNGRKAWYLERPSQGDPDGPPLVILPGATVNMTFMGIQFSELLKSMSKRRVIVMELPHHGKNVSLDYDFTAYGKSLSSMKDHLEDFRTSLGIDGLFDLLGYSLGGGVAAHYVLENTERVRRLILLAPYFYETSSDEFNENFDGKNWRNIHPWETLEEMKHFFNRWLGLDSRDTFPSLIMHGLNAIRSELYPLAYWSRFYDSFSVECRESDSFLEDNRDSLSKLKCPILLFTGKEDAICDPKKLTSLQDIFNPDSFNMTSLQSGHFFGPKGKSICEYASPELIPFLSD